MRVYRKSRNEYGAYLMVITTIVVGLVLFLLTRRYLFRPKNTAALLFFCMLLGAIVDASFVSHDLIRVLHAKSQASLARYGPVSR